MAGAGGVARGVSARGSRGGFYALRLDASANLGNLPYMYIHMYA